MFLRIISTFLTVLALSVPLNAGPASDRFALCLVKATTPTDQVTLIRWIAAIIGEHPNISDLASVSRMEQDTIDKELAELFTRLVAVDCKTEAFEASVLDGTSSFEDAFEVLGQVAMVNLMEHEQVLFAFEGFLNHIDLRDFEFLE